MNIILHIGLEKTGTSTIQSLLKLNPKWLAENRVWVPQSLRPYGNGDSHAILPALFCRDQHAIQLRKFSGQPDDIDDENFFQNVSTAFSNEVIKAKKSGFNGILISSEHLSSRLHTLEEIAALANWLKQYGVVKKIIVYLRRQDNFVISSYSTELKSGSVRHFSLPALSLGKERYDYQHILTLWSSIFGQECLLVRPFEIKQWINHNLIDDFSHYAGLRQGKPTPSEDKNQSLDPKSLSILLNYNQWAQKTNFEKEVDGRERLVKSLSLLSTPLRICLSGADAMGFVARYNDGNAWVAKNFLEASNLLFNEPINPEQKSCMLPAIDVFDFYPLLMATLMKKNKSPKVPTVITNDSLFKKITKFFL